MPDRAGARPYRDRKSDSSGLLKYFATICCVLAKDLKLSRHAKKDLDSGAHPYRLQKSEASTMESFK